MADKSNKKIQSFFIFLRRYIFAPAQAIVAIATIFVIMKTNTITNTANLLQINDAIQQRTDIVFAIELKQTENEISASENMETIAFHAIVNKTKLLNAERRAAVTSLLNTYEFACSQYLKNKIDKEAFKLFYFDMIKHIKTEYDSFFEARDGITSYTAIDRVYREWYGR